MLSGITVRVSWCGVCVYVCVRECECVCVCVRSFGGFPYHLIGSPAFGLA